MFYGKPSTPFMAVTLTSSLKCHSLGSVRLMQWGVVIDGRDLQAALALARRHSLAPQFARSLEWLLFTALEADADMGPKGGVRHAFLEDYQF
jgi:hypothetical protein